MSTSQQRKRLLVVTSTYPRWPGDYEPSFVHELSSRLTERFDVTVIAPHAPGALRHDVMDYVNVYRFKYAPERLETLVNNGGILGNIRQNKWKTFLLPLFFIAQIWAIIRINRQWRPDIIHAHWLIPQGFTCAIALRLMRSGTPLFLTSHGSDLNSLSHPFYTAIKRWTVKHLSGMTVVSKPMLAQTDKLNLDRRKIRIAPMGTDLLNRFFPSKENSVRKSNEILFVGRIEHGKGLPTLLRAVRLVAKDNPTVKLKIIGTGTQTQRCIQLTKELEIESNVEFLGAKSPKDLPQHYRAANLLCAPFTTTQGLGLVIIESLGCGCPTIVSNLPQDTTLADIKAVIQIPPDDPDHLANAIKEQLRLPCRINEEERQRLLATYDWQAVGKNYSELLANAREMPWH